MSASKEAWWVGGRRNFSRMVFLAAFAMPVAAYAGAAKPAGELGKLELLTPDQADAGEYVGPDMPPVTRSIGGPSIEVITPDMNAVTLEPVRPPVAIHLKFNPGIGAELNEKSLKVTYLKAWGFDITDRIAPYMHDGEISHDKVELPKGKHKIRVEIQDTNQKKAAAEFAFEVAK